MPVTAVGPMFIVILGLLTAFAPMSIDLYLPALPAISDALGASSAATQQSLSVFFLGLALGQLAHGPLSDRFGRRPVLMSGIALYVLASIACAFAGEIGTLIAARFVQGLGGAVGPVVARAAVRDVYSGARAARAMSFVILVMAMAPLVAPTLGGQILTYLGWRGLFWVLAAFGAVCLAVTVALMPETNGRDRRGEASLLRRFTAYLRLLNEPRAVAYLLCGGLIFGSLFAYVTAAPFVYIQRFGVDPAWFGLYIAINVGGLVVGNLFNSRLVMRFGYRRLLGGGAVVSLFGAVLLLASALSDPDHVLMVVLPLFVAVGCIGIVGANTVAGLLDLFPGSSGAASALFGVAQFLFGAAGGALVGALPLGALTAMGAVMAASSALAVVSYVVLRHLDRTTAATVVDTHATGGTG